MALDDIVDLTITASTAAPTREGFGLPLIASYHNIGAPARVGTYRRASDVSGAGFSTSHGAYVKSAILCSQANKVKNFKIGRLANAPAQTVTLVCTSAVAGDVYAIEVTPQGSTKVAITRTVPSSSSTTAEAVALAALIDALPYITATSSGSTVTVTTTAAGDITTYENWSTNIRFTDTTADPGIAADLDAIQAADPNWYVLLVDATSEAILDVAAAWAQANGKLLVACTSNYGVSDGTNTTDVASDLKGSAYDHTALYYNGKKCPGQTDAGIAGARLPFKPGEDSWNYKTIAGVPVDQPTASATASFTAKNVNWYELIQGLNLTQGQGKVSSGQYIDIVRGLDWLKSEIKIGILTLFANSKKVPYTDEGVAQVVSVIKAALRKGIRYGLIAATPAPTVTAPLVADIDPAEKAGRNLPDIEFGCTLAGAVDTVAIAGNASF